MSGIYNIEHYVMTWQFLNCEQGSGTCLFQETLLHNESCEREAHFSLAEHLEHLELVINSK